MKKTIALFLAMLMVLSIVPLAFAENETAEEPSDDGGEEDEGSVITIIPGDTNDTSEDEAEEDEAEEDEAEDNETETEEDDVVEVPEEVTAGAGITPDSPLYGLERAMERISLALTFGKSAKAKKGLAHARERLMEVQAMIAQKKMDKAGIAQEGYENTMDEVEDNIADLGDGDAVGELQDEVEIENALDENEDLLAQVGNLKTKFKGLTPEQEAEITSIVGNLGDSISKAKVQVQAKKNKTKIKIKAQGEMTDEEVAQVEEQVRAAVQAGERVQVQIKVKEKKGKRAGDDDEVEAEEDETEEDEAEGNETEEDSDDEEDEAEEDTKGKSDKSNKGKNKDSDEGEEPEE